MKIFKDRFMEWLDKNIALHHSLNTRFDRLYEVALTEAKEKLQSIIAEEMEKMKTSKTE